MVVALTPDPTSEVLDYLASAAAPPVGTVITIGGSDGVAQDAVADASAALSWCRSARNLILPLSPRPARLHLFLACSTGVALFLGHHRNLLPPIVAYEHLLPGYTPTFTS